MKNKLALTLLFVASGFVPLYERIYFTSSAKATIAFEETVAVFPDFFRTLFSPVDSDVVISLLYFAIAGFFLFSLWRKKPAAAYTQTFTVILLNAFALIYLLRPLNNADSNITIVTGAGYYVYCALLLAFDALCFLHFKKQAKAA